jgi:hypothetical protein
MEKYTIKLLSMILAFAGYADPAHAADKLIKAPNGTTYLIKEYSTQLVAKGYTTHTNGSTLEHVVYDCNKGYGSIESYRPIQGTYDRKYFDTFEWQKGGHTVSSQIATYICGTAIGKVSK